MFLAAFKFKLEFIDKPPVKKPKSTKPSSENSNKNSVVITTNCIRVFEIEGFILQ